MQRAYDVITFDCYGTLIDWESGILRAFAGERAGLDPESVLTTYARTEAEVEHERYRPYREVLAESARRVAAELGWSTTGAFLPESLPSWMPFGDTNAALERLRDAGHVLGILSNVDDDLLAATRLHFTADFELVITAQQVRSYKPAAGHFLAARERIGARRWLHAAQSNFHDIVPANALAIPSAWVNRHGQTALPGGTPTHEVRDLRELADLLISQRA
jgi:2-haloalkanoic acid dehalogenase type II